MHKTKHSSPRAYSLTGRTPVPEWWLFRLHFCSRAGSEMISHMWRGSRTSASEKDAEMLHLREQQTGFLPLHILHAGTLLTVISPTWPSPLSSPLHPAPALEAGGFSNVRGCHFAKAMFSPPYQRKTHPRAWFLKGVPWSPMLESTKENLLWPPQILNKHPELCLTSTNSLIEPLKDNPDRQVPEWAWGRKHEGYLTRRTSSL